MNATRAPSSAARMEAENPADPAPITARSYWPFTSVGGQQVSLM